MDKKKSEKVYIVFEHEHPHNYVHSVYSDREAAEKKAESMTGQDWHFFVKEYEIQK